METYLRTRYASEGHIEPYINTLIKWFGMNFLYHSGRLGLLQNEIVSLEIREARRSELSGGMSMTVTFKFEIRRIVETNLRWGAFLFKHAVGHIGAERRGAREQKGHSQSVTFLHALGRRSSALKQLARHLSGKYPSSQTPLEFCTTTSARASPFEYTMSSGRSGGTRDVGHDSNP